LSVSSIRHYEAKKSKTNIANLKEIRRIR